MKLHNKISKILKMEKQHITHIKVDTGMSRIGFSDTKESVEYY
jgi:alanine racemase